MSERKGGKKNEWEKKRKAKMSRKIERMKEKERK